MRNVRPFVGVEARLRDVQKATSVGAPFSTVRVPDQAGAVGGEVIHFASFGLNPT